MTSQLSKFVGVEGYPTAAIISPTGELLWKGHPSQIPNKVLKTALKGASKHLSFGWSEDFADAAKALSDGEFADALEAAKGSSAEGADAVAQEIMDMVERSVTSMTAALDKGDFLGAQTAAEKLETQLKGLPEAQKATDTLAKIAADPTSKDTIKGQEKLTKLMEGDLKKKGSVKKAIKAAEKLVKKHPGTIVETDAKAWIAELEAMKE